MNGSGLEDRIISVVSAPKAGAKFVLADLPGLAVFLRFGGNSWDREFQRHLASGNRQWFVPRGQAALVKVFCYRENGGIPYEAVATRSSSARARNASHPDYVTGIRVHWPQAALPSATLARNREPVILSIPVANESDDREPRVGGLLARSRDRGARTTKLRGFTFFDRLRGAPRRNISG